MVVSFFGHRDTPEDIYKLLYMEIRRLILEEGAKVFYCGEQGAFDRMAIKCLLRLNEEFSYIRCYNVLAYYPPRQSSELQTIYPEGQEEVPIKYAIDRRNQWLVEKSDVIITYVWRSFGGAAKFKHLARQKGKRIIELNEYK